MNNSKSNQMNESAPEETVIEVRIIEISFFLASLPNSRMSMRVIYAGERENRDTLSLKEAILSHTVAKRTTSTIRSTVY